MQNALRKWLVGIGLLVTLLALTVPALAQNQWIKQTTVTGSTTGTTFNTPVQTVAVNPGNWVAAGTAGGGFPGGTAGLVYQDAAAAYGDVFANYAITPCAPATGQDYTDTYVDVADAKYYLTSWDSGLYSYDGAMHNYSCGLAYVNQHMTSMAMDTVAATHMLYLGTWGGGVFQFNTGTHAFVQLPALDNYGTNPFAAFVHDVVVVPAACPGSPLTVYAATDGAGIYKAEYSCATSTWSWTPMSAGLGDQYVYSLAMNGSTLVAGTRTAGIYSWDSVGSTWMLMSSSSSLSGIAIKAIIPYANSYETGFFAATMGAGVLRYDPVLAAQTTTDWYPINTGFGGANLVDENVYSLAYDSANMMLYAGTAVHAAPTQGNFWRINLMRATDTLPGPYVWNIEAGQAVNLPLTFTNNQNPCNFLAYITTGTAPLGITLSADTTGCPAAPAVNLGGTATEDCVFGYFTCSYWDALHNRTDVQVRIRVKLHCEWTVDLNPTQLGYISQFTSTVVGAPAGSVNYMWYFDWGGPNQANPTWQSTQQNPQFVYPAAGTFRVRLEVTDPACLVGALGTNHWTSPADTANIVVTGTLNVNPVATLAGSGSQFQWLANATGGLPTCAMPPSTDGYNYSWVFWDVTNPANPVQVATSTDPNPTPTFASFGDFRGDVTVTDCSGHSVTGSAWATWNGQMAATLQSQLNPIPTNYAGVFFASGLATAAAENCAGFLAEIDQWGDGTPGAPFPMIGPVNCPLGPPAFTLTHSYATANMIPGYLVKGAVTDSPLIGTPHTTHVYMYQKVYTEFSAITVTSSPNAPACQLTTDQPITFSVTPVGGLPPYNYAVVWGDGLVAPPFSAADASTQTFTHTYAAGGPYVVKILVTDSGNPQVVQTYVGPGFTVIAPFTSATITTDAVNPYGCTNQTLGFQKQGAANGSGSVAMVATPTTGIGPYTYQWSVTPSTGVGYVPNSTSQTPTINFPAFSGAIGPTRSA